MAHNYPSASGLKNQVDCIFPGARKIYEELFRLYPDQCNPCQVATKVKYWMGGSEPLDYIPMFLNPGNPAESVPEHWHYVSLGLSDLHGDCRVHDRKKGSEKSGFGFELTFRLKREPGELDPPYWPARLMQALAKYVFFTGNQLWAGDHIAWHKALDGDYNGSLLTHILLVHDSQIQNVQSVCGTVEFLQIVGVTRDELKQIQCWNGPSFADVMRRFQQCGGSYLVTDMRRESILDSDPSLKEEIQNGITKEGSNLSGVSVAVAWKDDAWLLYDQKNLELLPEEYQQQLLLVLNNPDEDCCMKSKSTGSSAPINSALWASSCKYEEATAQFISDKSDNVAELNLHSIHYHDTIHIRMNLEAAEMMSTALKGRLKHNHHFTFKSVSSRSAVTFVIPEMEGSFANEENRFAARGEWLHVLIDTELLDKMISDFDAFEAEFNDSSALEILPKTFFWPEQYLAITVSL